MSLVVPGFSKNLQVRAMLKHLTLLASFVAGIGFAVGHHFFYASLHERPVDSVAFEQQYNTALGTTFAFLARAALITSITTSYWQVFYKRLHRSLPISTIDSLAGILGALQEFLALSNLKASPLLVILALLAWLIPIAVIFPPATLTVIPTKAMSVRGYTFQTPNYTNADAFSRVSFQFWGGMGGNSAPSHEMAIWGGPTSRLRRSLIPVAYQWQLPTISAPARTVNSSYNMQFFGPAVSCQNTIPDPIIANLTAAVGGCNSLSPGALPLSLCGQLGGSDNSYYYVAWTPGDTIVPFANNSINDTFPITSTLGADTNDLVELFVASRRSLDAKDQWTVLNCSLHNASYAVSFAFENGQQNISLSTYEVLNPVRRSEYQGVVPTDTFALSDPQARSYFAVIDLLGDLLGGTMWYSSGDGFSTPAQNTTDHTQILETKLAITQELNPLYTMFTGELPTARPFLSPLASAIEELVRNMTLSMLAVPALLAPQAHETDVSITTFSNVYHYNWQRLVLAYGIAISLTFLAVTLGFYTIASTGSCYSNKFSTILRVSRNEELDSLIEEDDRHGEDPLPEYIGKAEFAAAGHTDKIGSAVANSGDDESERQALKRGRY